MLVYDGVVLHNVFITLYVHDKLLHKLKFLNSRVILTPIKEQAGPLLNSLSP